MKEMIIFEKTETLAESIASDVVTFLFLLLCIWFSYSQGGGWWTFLAFLAVKIPGGAKSRCVKLSTKKEAISWAESLPDDGADNII